MPLLIADFSVGQRADASVAETISAFAPLVIADWIAGICEAAVACVPLVSVPFSPSLFSAASAPPDFTLSAVVKYGLPRFLGMTKTFSPLLSGVADDEAIAIGTKAMRNTSASAGTCRRALLLIECRITRSPFDGLQKRATSSA